MKVKHITQLASAIRTDVACTKCGADVDHSFIYCPKCGKKLLQLPSIIKEGKVCEVLTAELRHNAEQEEHALERNPQPDLIANALTIACPRGKTSPKECEFLDKNGTCTGIVYPTYPPQRDMCSLLDPRTNIPISREIKAE